MNFKIGDRVQISCTKYNPELDGSIAVVSNIRDDGFYIRVNWETGPNKGLKNDGDYESKNFILIVPFTYMSSNSLTEKFQSLFVKEPEKSFRKLGITNDKSELTKEGQDLFLAWLFKSSQTEFKKEVVDPLLAAEEQDSSSK